MHGTSEGAPPPPPPHTHLLYHPSSCNSSRIGIVPPIDQENMVPVVLSLFYIMKNCFIILYHKIIKKEVCKYMKNIVVPGFTALMIFLVILVYHGIFFCIMVVLVILVYHDMFFEVQLRFFILHMEYFSSLYGLSSAMCSLFFSGRRVWSCSSYFNIAKYEVRML